MAGAGLKYRTAQEASEALKHVTAERLVELAQAGFAPHYYIDDTGPLFRMQELRDWFERNRVRACKGMTMPTRLDIVAPETFRPAMTAPQSISHIEGLRHIDPAYLWQPGVYFLCDETKVLYVGQSVNVQSRVMTHVRDGRKQFDHTRIFYFPVPESELRQIEAELIRMLRPKYNHNARGQLVT